MGGATIKLSSGGGANRMSDVTIRLIQGVPDPERVRSRLGEVLREAGVLRSVLRLSERAVRDRERATRIAQRGSGNA